MQHIPLSQHPLPSNAGSNSSMDLSTAVPRKEARSPWLLKPGASSARPKSAGPRLLTAL